MDCRAYCTAVSFAMKPLSEYLKSQYQTNFFREVLHVEIPFNHSQGHLFFFPYGSIVCWGLSKEKENQLLQEISPFEEKCLDEIETDLFTYTTGEPYKIVEDEIFLPSQEVPIYLAVSHAIAQSVKLSFFEVTTQNTFNEAKEIPENLAREGKIPLSKKEIRRKMGELFIERNSINLHVNMLDTPDFFWENTELEPYYQITANYLDIKDRVEVLNQRLSVIHELYQMLGSELNNQHAHRLEMTIIWLIVIEVVLTLLRDVFKIL